MKHEWWRNCRNFNDFSSCDCTVYCSIVCEDRAAGSAYVVESLGKYKGTWATGLHFKVPFIERVAIRVNLKEQVVDFPPQPVITKDNVTMQIDYGRIFPDYRSEAVRIRCCKSADGH